MPRNVSSIHFSINGREFYAEGDAAEVKRKLDEFMAEVFAPLNRARQMFHEPSWRDVLGIKSKNPTRKGVLHRFRALALRHHPDRGGSPDVFRKIVAARDAALNDIRDGLKTHER